jgi:hypothetical protein
MLVNFTWIAGISGEEISKKNVFELRGASA